MNIRRHTMNWRSGLTLIELLVVVSILAFLIIAGTTAFQLQRQRGYDARRKSDLAKLKVVFEDYYNDRKCYPTIAMMSHCDQNDLQPYMDKVPCDPLTHAPYGYSIDITGACNYYGVFTVLQDTSDPVIEQIGCSPTCAPGKPYNYGITSSGVPLSTLASQIGLSGGSYACSPSGQCNIYADPIASGCTVTYTDPTSCQQGCGIPANRCAQ